MKRYGRIYLQLIRLNISKLFAYRANLLNSLMASVGWGAMSLLSVVLLTSRLTDAYGWTRSELLLFNGLYGVIIGFFHMFVSVNMHRLSRVIHMGDLDGILVKPLDSQFAVSFWEVNFATTVRILMASAFTVWVWVSLGVSVSLIQMVLFIMFASASLVLLYSIWFLILTNLIWFTNLSNLELFLYSFESMARFPKEMLLQLSGFVLATVFPLALVINTPARALLGRLDTADAALLCILAGVLWIAARRYWQFALRYYTSASS